jgi:lipoyl synthase
VNTHRLQEAREKSWEVFGRKLTFYVPAMIRCDGVSGKYQALSITGDECALQCEHCKGGLLRSMHRASTPEALVAACLQFHRSGNHGVLISGGCDRNGRLPWDRFLSAIREIKDRTDLLVSIHSGLVDRDTACRLKEAGVDQALIDVVGDDETYRRICHVPFGTERIISSVEALESAGLEVVPHVVCGLDFGAIKGERKALQIVSGFSVSQLVIVSVMEIQRKVGAGFRPPRAQEIAEIIAQARLLMPRVLISLGCARQRGNRRLEQLAIDAGVNRMALPSEEAVEHARRYGLEVRFQATCCSVSEDVPEIPSCIWRVSNNAQSSSLPIPTPRGAGRDEKD